MDTSVHGSQLSLSQVGKVGDLIVLNEKKWEHVVYQLGQQDVIRNVIKRGEVVV